MAQIVKQRVQVPQVSSAAPRQVVLFNSRNAAGQPRRVSGPCWNHHRGFQFTQKCLHHMCGSFPPASVSTTRLTTFFAYVSARSCLLRLCSSGHTHTHSGSYSSGLALTICLLLLVGFQGTNMLQGLAVYAHTVEALLLLMNCI